MKRRIYMKMSAEEDLLTRREYGLELLEFGAKAMGVMIVASSIDVAEAIAQSTNTTHNVIMSPGADPSITTDPETGELLYCGVGGADSCGIYIRRAKSVRALHRMSNTPFQPEEMVWSKNQDKNSHVYLGHLAALWGAKYCIGDQQDTIYAATYDGKTRDNQRIAAFVPSGPNNQFRLAGLMETGKTPSGEYEWAIDGIAFTYQDKRYFSWSEKDTTGGPVNQNIYLNLLSDDGLTLLGERVLVSSPEYDWEKFDGKEGINEDPFPFVSADGQTLSIYISAGPSWTSDQVIAQTTLIGTDPLKDLFLKTPEPVMSGTPEIPGTGSPCFFQDRKRLMMAYSTETSSEDVWEHRVVRAKRVTTDLLGLPIIPLPSFNF